MPEVNEHLNETEPDIQQPVAAEEAKKTESKKSVGREIFEWIMVFVVAITAALAIRTFIFEPVRVDGTSMVNTLHDNEYMVVTKYQYLFNDPARFDVVICRYPSRGNTNFVKRIVGIPGDTVAVHGGKLYVNGEEVDEPYIDVPMLSETPETLVEEGHYFVMGDNRNNSNDSRSQAVGQLTRSQIRGQVRLVAWPIGDFRLIH